MKAAKGKYSVTIQMKAIEQYFPVVLYKVVLIFESVDKILKCSDHSNNATEAAVLSFSAVYYAVQGGSNFRICDHSNEMKN